MPHPLESPTRRKQPQLHRLSKHNGPRWALLLLTVLACLTLSDAHEEHQALNSKGAHVEDNLVFLERRAWEALAPQLAQVERRTLRRTVLATGQLTVPPNARAVASSWLPGRIEKITVELGQSVQAGQVVAWVRSADWEKLLTDYVVAQNEAAAARLEAQRINSLYREALVSRQEWLEAQARRREKENALLITRLQIRALVEEIPSPDALLPVRSPISGHVARFHAAVGEDIEPRHPILEILNTSAVWMRASVPQFYSALIAPGQTAEVRLRAVSSGEPIRARVLARSQQIDPATLTETVWIELLDPLSPHWRIGMPGTVRIEVARRENVLAIPASAVIQEGMETYAFVARSPDICCREHDHDAEALNNSHQEIHAAFERVFFIPGMTTPDWVEVSSGLQEGDQVVTAGRHQLAVLLPPRHEGEFRLSPQAWQRYEVRIEPVSFHPVRDTLTLEASIAISPSLQQQLHSPVSGILHRWHVLAPGPVRQGQVVAEVVSWELQQWQLAWLQTELAAQSHESMISAYRELIAHGVPLSEQLLRNTELTWRSTRTLADNFKSRLRKLAGLSEHQLHELLHEHKLVAHLELTAPCQGWALPSSWACGQFLSPSQSILEIWPRTTPAVRARLPEFMSSGLSETSAARFRPSLAGKPFWPAHIFYFEPGRLGEHQRYLWAQLEAIPAQLPMQLKGTLTVELNGQASPVLAVPASALWWEGNQPAVFVYHHDRDVFEYRPVVVGKMNDLWAEILSGLQAGEYIATSAVADLRRHYGRLRSGTGFYCEHCRD
ncbi:MAG: efflux RND transporter periplasmic adaptor subunit [Gemmatales bacterium]|nr:efflux RND transporter periplasmic adaptor subunit [Gemmatales bacterium]